jgi:hypothetical protein
VARSGPARASAIVVILRALRRIIANADIKRIIGAAKDIAVIHRNALRLAQNTGSLRAKFRCAKFWRRGS